MVLNIFKLFGPSNRPWVGFRSTVGSATVTKIQYDWKNIEQLLEGNQPSQLRQALIFADKALDNALKDVVAGEAMGERLKNAGEKFEKDMYNKIWSAHKMRNSLVHESGYEPPHHMLTQNINVLKKALGILGVSI